MYIHFWGVRGSIPTPISSAAIQQKIVNAFLSAPPTLDIHNQRDVESYVEGLPPLVRGTAGGNTACVEVRSGNTLIIIDAGSGLRELGLELMRGPCGRGQGVIHLFLSHPHWDHIQGFPFFTPAFIPGNRIIFYSVHDVQKALTDQQQFLTFPIPLDYMRATREFVRISEEHPFTIDGLDISILRNPHPGDSYSFRISDRHSTFVYASDAEYKDLSPVALQPRIEFFRNADAVVFDAQYTLKEAWQKVDWGHSSAMIGSDIARDAGVRRLILFHHDPTYSDSQLEVMYQTAVRYQAQDTEHPACEMIIAYEGLTLDLTPPGSIERQALDDGSCVLTATSVFDTQAMHQIAEQLDTYEGDVFVNLADVKTLSTQDLKELVALIRTYRDRPVVLISPSAAVDQVIRLSGYADFFAIYPTVKAAQESMRLRRTLNLPGYLLKNRYRIEQYVGENLMGISLRATDTQTATSVAIRILGAGITAATVTRLLASLRAYAQIAHPRLRRILAADQDGDITYIVSVWLKTWKILDQVYAPQPPTQDELMALGSAIAQGLYALHQRGIVHGDLRPANVLLTDNGVQLSYTGAGQLMQGIPIQDTPLFLDVAYLAPEQILGHPIDARSDLYALGVILFELATGQRPFTGSNVDVLHAHLHTSPPIPHTINPRISPSLEHLITKLLAKNPLDRYTNAQQVVNVLENIDMDGLNDHPTIALVGREREEAQLLALWKQASDGHGRIALIGGEAGIGKSRLAHHFAHISGASVVLVGYCHEQPDAIYAPFAEVISDYIASAPPEIHDNTLFDTLAVVAQLAPNLRVLFPHLPEPPRLEPQAEQLRLLRCLSHFIEQASFSRPWILIIEDLQWADVGSNAAFQALSRNLAKSRLLLIGTYRDHTIDHQHPFYRLLHNLRQQPECTMMPLGSLDSVAVEAMLTTLWNRTVPTVVLDQVMRSTSGNPFYVESLAQEIVATGIIEHTDLDTDALPLPPSVQAIIQQRIERLSPETQRVVEAASVLGMQCSMPLLQSLSGFDEKGLLEHLDSALEQKMLRERGCEFAFTQTMIQATVYARLEIIRRRRLHLQAAQAIEQLAKGNTTPFAAELAYHYDAAGATIEALDYTLLAAKQAVDMYANERALRLYRRALSLAAKLEKVPDRRATASLEAFEGIGHVLRMLGSLREAYDAFEQALAVSLEQGDVERYRHLQAEMRVLQR